MTILGLDFFDSDAAAAVQTMCTKGGLLVAPSGTCFARLQRDANYRRAMTSADLALADSGFMVLLWRILRGKRAKRISGLTYLKQLVKDPTVRSVGATFWILPNDTAREKAIAWAPTQGIQITAGDCYSAPYYGPAVHDETAVTLIDARRPRHIVIGIGAGAQEKLGYYLRERLDYRPAIHCTGGALGFLTGDQTKIPDWADRLYLGWLFRLLANPRVFVPRLWSARKLPLLIIKHGEDLPSMVESRKAE
jgi:UDP-N-acetyl-D-mannosaminuronic acid transferase (WecB/TagA/CpsF family)